MPLLSAHLRRGKEKWNIRMPSCLFSLSSCFHPAVLSGDLVHKETEPARSVYIHVKPLKHCNGYIRPVGGAVTQSHEYKCSGGARLLKRWFHVDETSNRQKTGVYPKSMARTALAVTSVDLLTLESLNWTLSPESTISFPKLDLLRF